MMYHLLRRLDNWNHPYEKAGYTGPLWGNEWWDHFAPRSVKLCVFLDWVTRGWVHD